MEADGNIDDIIDSRIGNNKFNLVPTGFPLVNKKENILLGSGFAGKNSENLDSKIHGTDATKIYSGLPINNKSENKDNPINTSNNVRIEPGKFQKIPVKPSQSFQEERKNSNLLELASIITHHIDYRKILKSLQDFQNFSSIEATKKFFCEKCFSLKCFLKLECGHLRCLCCTKIAFETYIYSPSIFTFLKLSCEVCKINASEIDFKKIMIEDCNSYQSYMNLSFKVECNQCSTSRVLHKNYYSELSCLHLCKNCYLNNLLMNYSACPVCDETFLYSNATKNRKAKCDACSQTISSVNWLRNIDAEHFLCYGCFTKSLYQSGCIVCQSNFDKKYVSMIYNKRCSKCNTVKPLDEIFIKVCCEYPLCLDCQNPKEPCLMCSKELQN